MRQWCDTKPALTMPRAWASVDRQRKRHRGRCTIQRRRGPSSQSNAHRASRISSNPRHIDIAPSRRTPSPNNNRPFLARSHHGRHLCKPSARSFRLCLLSTTCNSRPFTRLALPARRHSRHALDSVHVHAPHSLAGNSHLRRCLYWEPSRLRVFAEHNPLALVDVLFLDSTLPLVVHRVKVPAILSRVYLYTVLFAEFVP